MNNTKYTLLDGGMGQELYQRGIRGDLSIWSSNGLLKAPEIVRDIHIEFIEAGADIITTNTYCTGEHCLEQVGLGDRAHELTSLACDLAIEARDKASNKDVKIAGGLPPLYGTYLPNIERDVNKMQNEYRQMIESTAGKVDLFLCETMTTADEAYAAASAASEVGVPVWVAWTLTDDPRALLRDETSIKDAHARLKDIENIEAYLFNCCIPEAISPALKQLSAITDKPLGAYANGFAPIPQTRERGDIDIIEKRHFNPAEYGGFVEDWLKFGASIIGGCCEIGSAHIKHVADILENR